MYHIKEIFYSIQGEGYHTGRPAVFCRFSGCNLWSGREEDRVHALCSFCDTDFGGTDGTDGGIYEDAGLLVQKIAENWPHRDEHCFVVCTGGEPLLQMDDAFIVALHKAGFEVAVETNGTIAAPAGIDWLCVSPKACAPLVQNSGDELKLVYPQAGLEPARYEKLAFTNFYLQPMDGSDRKQATRLSLHYVLENPRWRLSLQMHKILNIR